MTNRLECQVETTYRLKRRGQANQGPGWPQMEADGSRDEKVPGGSELSNCTTASAGGDNKEATKHRIWEKEGDMPTSCRGLNLPKNLLMDLPFLSDVPEISNQ